MVDSEYDPHLNFQEIATTKDSKYTIREVKIERQNIDIFTPYKTIDGKYVNVKDFRLVSGKIDKPIYESWSYVVHPRSLRNIKYLVEEAGSEKIRGLDKIFGIRKNLWDDAFSTLSLVFGKNPFITNIYGKGEKKTIIEPIEKDGYESLLDYIHTASKTIVLTPDVRIQHKNISIEDYVKFVDESIRILSYFNKKPIFAPIQIHLPQKHIRAILEHYKEKNYTNIWINFNASHIGSTYFARVRTLMRLIDYTMGLKNVLLYYSHLKKEINPIPKYNKAVPSDILTQFFTAGFVGITRPPTRPPFEQTPADREKRIMGLVNKGDYKSKEHYEKCLIYNKYRIFDRNSYYYYTLNSYPERFPLKEELLLNPSFNRLLNSILLYHELERTKISIENQQGKKKELHLYIKEKDAIRENNDLLNGIIEKVTAEQEQKGLFDYLGEL